MNPSTIWNCSLSNHADIFGILIFLSLISLKSQYFIAESTAQNVFSYAMIGDSVILQCQNTPGNTIIQWLRLNPSKNVTKCTYTDGWAVNEEIRNHHRITIIGSINSTTYNLQIENLTVSDSGEYRCVSQATNKRKSYDVHLCVRGTSRIITTELVFYLSHSHSLSNIRHVLHWNLHLKYQIKCTNSFWLHYRRLIHLLWLHSCFLYVQSKNSVRQKWNKTKTKQSNMLISK